MIENKKIARYMRINDARVYYSMGRERIKKLAAHAGALSTVDGVAYIDTEKLNSLLSQGVEISTR